MRFQVPQFIETETKIVGPFTLKQFLWVAGGVAIMFFLFMVLPLYAFIIFSIPVGVVFGSFAFLKIDNVPLFNYFVYSVAYMLNPRRYFFKKAPSSDEPLQTKQSRPAKKPKKNKVTEPVPEEEVADERKELTFKQEADQETSGVREKPKKPKDDRDDNEPPGGYIENEYIVR